MAYIIQYSPESSGKYPQIKKQNSHKLGGWFLLLAILIAAVWIRIYGIPDFLIPGDPQVTKSAAVMMITNLQEGVKIEDAIAVFCEQILVGAGH